MPVGAYYVFHMQKRKLCVVLLSTSITNMSCDNALIFGEGETNSGTNGPNTPPETVDPSPFPTPTDPPFETPGDEDTLYAPDPPNFFIGDMLQPNETTCLCGMPPKRDRALHRINPNHRIVGGFEVLGPIPWQAAIVFNDHLLCGGSLIAPKYVLSAAHCFIDVSLDGLEIVIGQISVSNQA